MSQETWNFQEDMEVVDSKLDLVRKLFTKYNLEEMDDVCRQSLIRDIYAARKDAINHIIRVQFSMKRGNYPELNGTANEYYSKQTKKILEKSKTY